MSIKCLRYVSGGDMSTMDMSAVGCGALEASFRAKPVANRRADAPPRLKAYIYVEYLGYGDF